MRPARLPIKLFVVDNGDWKIVQTLEPHRSHRSPHRNLMSRSLHKSSVFPFHCAISAKTNTCGGLGSWVPKGMSWTSLLFGESLVSFSICNGDRGFRNSSRSRISCQNGVIRPFSTFHWPLLASPYLLNPSSWTRMVQSPRIPKSIKAIATLSLHFLNLLNYRRKLTKMSS